MDMNIFNNKVVARFACRQKRSDLKAQFGRSMIEMLGVLAIIGVLSVGGIAGYSKAMERYRVNETINQVTYIVQNTRDLFKIQPDAYASLSSSSSVMSTETFENRILADKTKLFPTSIVKNDYKNLFGGNIRFHSSGRFVADDNKAFILDFRGIPQDACIEIATRDWAISGVIVMDVWTVSDQIGKSKNYQGNCRTRYNAEGVNRICSADMPMATDKAVLACGSKKDNNIAWKFY